MNEHCKIYDFHGPITQSDLDWMYNSGIEIYVEHPYEDGDSGWCDATTGHQIITAGHKFYAMVMNDEQDTWLKLYWEDRATHRVSIHSATHKYEDVT